MDSLLMRVVKRGIQVVIAVLVPLALASGYRAYFQVHSLVDVVVEIEQDGHRETIASQLVPGNRLGALEPRWHGASQSIVLTPGMLEKFYAGPALIRATATGRPQRMRVPPPLVRERRVTVG